MFCTPSSCCFETKLNNKACVVLSNKAFVVLSNKACVVLYYDVVALSLSNHVIKFI